jgi:hypothetical protein
MDDYDLNDEQLQRRYEAFKAESLLLTREIALLRAVLESALQKGHNRLALDAIGQLNKLCLSAEGMQIRAKELIPRAQVLALAQDFGRFVTDTLNEQGLPQPVIDNIVNGILTKVHRRRDDVLLLENKTP